MKNVDSGDGGAHEDPEIDYAVGVFDVRPPGPDEPGGGRVGWKGGDEFCFTEVET